MSSTHLLVEEELGRSRIEGQPEIPLWCFLRRDHTLTPQDVLHPGEVGCGVQLQLTTEQGSQEMVQSWVPLHDDRLPGILLHLGIVTVHVLGNLEGLVPEQGIEGDTDLLQILGADRFSPTCELQSRIPWES